jgi:hypothetical protein
MAAYSLHEMMAERPLRFGDHSATGCDYFDYQPNQPNLFMLMNFKHLLVKEHGLEKGFDLYRKTITRQKDAALNLCRLESHHNFSITSAKAFFEVIPAGEPFTIMPPEVIGEGNHRPLTNITRSFYVCCLENALVRGRSSIIEVGDVALADFQVDELARIDDQLEFDAAVFLRDDEKVWTISQNTVPLKFDTALSLLGCRTDFFGDWLSDYITRYVAGSLSGYLPPVPILLDASMPKTHRQALELMLAPGAQIIEIPSFQSVQVRNLWSVPGIGYIPFHQVLNEKFKWDFVMSSPGRFIPVKDEMCRRADLAVGPKMEASHIYLARKSFRHRKLVNHAEIEGIVAAHGFSIIYPEDFDFAEQVRFLRDARYVMAPEGSALFLCYFMERGSKLCILNHEETEGLVGYEVLDMELTIISGPPYGDRGGRSIDRDYVINPDVVRRFLDKWPKGPTQPESQKGSLDERNHGVGV